MNTILIIFAFYALTFAIKESWLFDKPRIFLIRQSVFLYHLFECYGCVGFYSGIAVYFISNHFHSFNFWEMIMYGLGSSGICLFIDAVISRLFR